jgi:hypothetical protein
MAANNDQLKRQYKINENNEKTEIKRHKSLEAAASGIGVAVFSFFKRRTKGGRGEDEVRTRRQG